MLSLTGRYCGSRGNNRSGSCYAAEMFEDRFGRGSLILVWIPTALDQLPCSLTKANFPCSFRLAWSFTLSDAQHDFRLSTPPRSEGGAPSKHFIDHHAEGVDVCLLGNSAIREAELVGADQLGGHVGPCTFAFVGARRHDEGHGGREGRKSKIRDTGLRRRPVLNEDVALKQSSIESTK